MKKIIVSCFILVLIISFAGYSPLMEQSVTDEPVLNISADEVKEISISTLPEEETYKRTVQSSEEISEIISYINGMKLTENFPENPNESGGMTIVIEFHCSDDSSLVIYSFGNMFFKVGEGAWLRMEHDEAVQLEELLLP